MLEIVKEVKSIGDDFKSLPRQEQVNALISDAKTYSLRSCIDERVLSEDDKKSFNDILNKLNTYQDIKLNVENFINLTKKYSDKINAFNVLQLVIEFHDLYELDEYNFVDKVFIPLFYGVQPQVNIPAAAQSVATTEKVTTGAAKNITGMDILNNCNAISKHEHQHGPDCQCGKCHGTVSERPVSNIIAPVHPEMTIDQKVELIKKHIKLVPGISAKVSEVDALIRLIESGMLKSKLKELGAACNPDFPMLVQTKKYKFDKNLYNFAFYAETNTPGKSILVLYNTKTTKTSQGFGNEQGYKLINTSEVK